MQISVRFLKFIRLHRYRLKLCLMLIVCAMFRLGEPRPLRRPLGLSSPTVPLFSRADWGREICVRIVRSRPGVGFQPPVSMGNVCVVLVIVPFLGSISGEPEPAAQPLHKAPQANG